MNRKAGVPDVVECDFTNHLHREAIVEILDIYARGISGGGIALTPDARKNLAGELERRANLHTILAFWDGIAVGLAVCVDGFSTFACMPLLNIHDLVVIPDFRGRGIARLMLGRVEEIARRLGCCKMTLEVLEGNAVAVNLYESLGFRNYELDPAMGRAYFLEKKLPLE